MKTQPHNRQQAALRQALALTFLTAMLFLAKPVEGFAQGKIPDSDGKPLPTGGPTADVDGSIYFKIDWADGALTRKGGQQYNGLKLRYDVYDDEAVFSNTNGDTEAPVYTDITGFTLKGIDGMDAMHFANGFPAVDDQTTASYYEVLSSGKTQLLKHYKKTIRERSGQGDNSVSKIFTDADTYYMYKNGALMMIKPDAKDIATALADKAPQITAYAKANHISYKNDADLGKLFDYYNTLP